MSRVAGNQVMIKENNQKLIIETLIENGRVSRADLAKMLKLSAPSVSNNIYELIENRKILEVGEGSSIGGRKPILLEFNYNYGYIISVDLSSQNLKIALGNLQPRIIELSNISIEKLKKGKEIVETIIENIKIILRNNKINEEKLLCIAIGFPGVVNENMDEMDMLPYWLGWDEINIKSAIEKNFNAKVIVKNDMNLAALGEWKYGSGKNSSNLVYVSVGMGVGSGLIINNKLYEGKRFAAGEVGYFISSVEDKDYNNRRYGLFESKIGIPAIIQRIKNDVALGKESKVVEIVEGDLQRINIDVIRRAAKVKDELVIGIFKEITNNLAVTLSNMSILLDLDAIILGGFILDLGYDFITPLNDLINSLIPLNTKVKEPELNQDVVIFGAFVIALEYIHKNILVI